MSVRKLSLQLDLDAGKFTVAARDATGALKTLKAETTSVSAALKAADRAFDGSVSSARTYATTLNKITTTKESLKSAQRGYVQELVRELDTLGMSSAQLREYEARQLGILTKSKALRDAIEKKSKALDEEAQAAQKAKDAEELRLATANDLITRLREEIILTKDGKDALELYRAGLVGVDKEVRALINEKEALLAIQRKEKAEADALADKQREEAAAKAAAAQTDREKAQAGSAFIQQLREEILVLQQGKSALEMYRAEQLGVGAEARALIQQKNDLIKKNKDEADALRKVASAARDKSEAERKAAYELSQHMRTIEAMEWAIDGEVASLKRKEAALNAVAAAEKRGMLTSEQALKYRQYAEDQHNNYVQSQKKGAGLKNHQVANLSYQINDVVSGLIMGQSPGMIAAQQGGQILQIFQQNGAGALGVIRGLGSAFASLAVPIATVVAALAPFAAVFALIARNNDTNKMLREFNAQIVLMGSNTSATAPQLEGLARQLDTYGTSLKNAKAEIGIFLKEGVDASYMESFGKTAEHLAKVMGIEVPQAASMTANAFTGGWKEIVKLQDATNAYSLDQLKQIKRLYDESKAAEARNLAYKIFSEKTLKAYNAAMGEGGLLMQSLAGAWDNLVTQMANIGPFKDATRELGKLLGLANDFLAKHTAVKNLSETNIKSQLKSSAQDTLDSYAKFQEAENRLRSLSDIGPDGKYVAKRDAQSFSLWKSAARDRNEALKEYRENRKRYVDVKAEDTRRNGMRAQTNDTLDPNKGAIDKWLKEQEERDRSKKTGEKANPGQEGLASLQSQLAGLKAQLQDTGSEYAKYQKLLSTDSTLARHIGNNKALADQYLEVAKAIDEANKKLKEKRELDKLIDDASGKEKELSVTNRNISNILGASGGDDIERARYASRIDQSVIDAGNTEEAKTAGEKAKAADAENSRRSKVASLAEDLVKANEAAKASADSLWAQINQGTSKLDKDIADIEAKYAKLIGETTGEDQQKAIARKNQLIGDTMRANIADLVVGWDKEAKQINANLVGDKKKAAKELLAIDVEMYRKQIEMANLSTEERKKALEALNKWYGAKVDEMKRNSPLAKMAEDWVNVTDNMEAASASWLNSFVDGLVDGKLSFSEFAESIVKDIAKIMLKAAIAKNVVKPLLEMTGLGDGASETDALANIGASVIKGSSKSGGTDWLGNIAKGVATFFGFPAFHTGGVVGQELAMMRYADASVFTHAPRFHTGRPIPGLTSDELPAILKKDEGVFTKQQMKALGDAQRVNQAPNVAINIENQTGQPVDAETGGMSFDGEKWVTNVVLSQLSRPGPMRDAFKSAQNGR